MPSKVKVLVTGASGVLGSAVSAALRDHGGLDVTSLSNTRTGEGLIQLDLLDSKKVVEFIEKLRPDWVIHCAAERRPDVAEQDPQKTQVLNISVPEHLAKLSKSLGFRLVYISTDYVFDGTSPPYAPSATPNPLQLYGRTKRDGELAVLGLSGADVIVLRVPVLYGPAPENSDSAVNILVDVVKDQSGKQYKMDHYATRYPTNVLDIAGFLARLTDFKGVIPPILHYSAAEPFTKYEMCLIFSKILGLPHGHIIPDDQPPTGAGATTRPRNTQLYTRETEGLGVEGGLGLTLFEEWWSEYLK
ncbi:NAD-binding protein [Pleurotus eryngii]|uniref:NAD-binding protein n=1 Tax=Pleurotus eryngii TaxID=5323 RepID=A0A9P5ZW41_PLEER|nr:NAD-binding protein [Pleurotus eryngii]